MGYYTDFVTGRILLPEDKVSAFVVAPVIHEAYPKHRARHPLHEQENFEPLSLSIQGTLVGEVFTPDADQQSLKIWLEFVSCADWPSFHEKHLVNRHVFRLGQSKMIDSWNGDSPEREVIFAVAYLHTSTLEKLAKMAFSSNDVDDEAKEAAAMMLDARERLGTRNFAAKSIICLEDHDPAKIASLANFGSPREACYMPLGGWWIYTPNVMSGFFGTERHPIPVSEQLVGSVKAYHQRNDMYSKNAVEQTYRDAGLFYRFMSALDCLGHIVQPSKSIMYDNRLETARVALNDIAISMNGVSKNSDLFADWIAHAKYPHLLEVRSTLAAVLGRLDEELPYVHKGSKYKEPVKYKYDDPDEEDILDENETENLWAAVQVPVDKAPVSSWLDGFLRMRFWNKGI